MTAFKAHEVDRVIATRLAEFPLVLLYGPDNGLVTERAALIAKATAKDDPANILSLDGDRVCDDPMSLADEANAISMFGGTRAIRVKNGRRQLQVALQPVFAAPPIDSRIIVEAGDLKGTAPLRALFEKHPKAVALPCYQDEGEAVRKLIASVMQEHGVAVEKAAGAALVELLGADRMRSRGELEKLALFCAGQGEVRLADVQEIVTDAAPLALNDLIDAAFSGEIKAIDAEATRNFAAGEDAGRIVGAALRHALQLRDMRLAIEDGKSGFEAARAARAFGPRAELLARQAGNWSVARLDRAVKALAEAMLTARKTAAIAESTAVRALWSVALAASARR
jgi:DNA polymerase III subunit delta